MPPNRLIIPVGIAVATSAFTSVGGTEAYAHSPEIDPPQPGQDPNQNVPPDTDPFNTTPETDYDSLPELPEDYTYIAVPRTGGTTLAGLAERYDVPLEVLQEVQRSSDNPDVFFVPKVRSTLHTAQESETTPRPLNGRVIRSNTAVAGITGNVATEAQYGSVEKITGIVATSQEGRDTKKSIVDRIVDKTAEVFIDGSAWVLKELTADNSRASSPRVGNSTGPAGLPPNVTISSDGPVTVTFNGQEVRYEPTSSVVEHNTSYIPAVPTIIDTGNELPPVTAETQTSYASYSEVLNSIPLPADLPLVEELKSISVNSPNGLRKRSPAYQEKVEWLEQHATPYVTVQNYLAFEKDGIDKTHQDIFRPERSSRQLENTACTLFHWMGGRAGSIESAALAMLNRDVIASANYFILADGTVGQTMPDNNVAYHAGPSRNYSCYGVEMNGFDVLDFTPAEIVSAVMLATKHHLDEGVRPERDIVAIQALGLDAYNDYATSNVDDDEIFGSIQGHGEAPEANGKKDPLSITVNLIFELSLQLYDEVIAYENQSATNSSDSYESGGILAVQSQQDVESASIINTPNVSQQYASAQSLSVVVSQQQYELMQRASTALTGDTSGVLQLFASRPQWVYESELAETDTSQEVSQVNTESNSNETMVMQTILPLLSEEFKNYVPRTPQQAEELSRLRDLGPAIKPSDVYYYMRAQGATVIEAATFTALIGRESSWRPGAVGDMSTEYSSYGLSQIRDFKEGVPQRDANYNLQPVYALEHTWDMYQDHGTGDKGLKPWRSTLPRTLTEDALHQAIRLPNDNLSSSQRASVDANTRKIAESVMQDVFLWEETYQVYMKGGLLVA